MFLSFQAFWSGRRRMCRGGIDTPFLRRSRDASIPSAIRWLLDWIALRRATTSRLRRSSASRDYSCSYSECLAIRLAVLRLALLLP